MPRATKPPADRKPLKPALTPLEAARIAEKFGAIPEVATWLKKVAVRREPA